MTNARRAGQAAPPDRHGAGEAPAGERRDLGSGRNVRRRAPACEATHVRGTVNLLEAVRHAAGVRAVVGVMSDKCCDKESRLVHQLASVVGTVGEELVDPGPFAAESIENGLGSGTVEDVGRREMDEQQTTVPCRRRCCACARPSSRPR